jgi:hypothetical protein
LVRMEAKVYFCTVPLQCRGGLPSTGMGRGDREAVGDSRRLWEAEMEAVGGGEEAVRKAVRKAVRSREGGRGRL